MNRPQAGFTLIEILVVILIVGIMASVASLAVRNWGSAQKIRALNHEIKLTIQFAKQQAMLEPAELGMVLFSDGYQFFRLSTNTVSQKSTWSAIEDPVLGFHPLPSDIDVKLRINNKNIQAVNKGQNVTPVLRISSSGHITPFQILIGEKAQAPEYEMIGTLAGDITTVELAR